MVKEIDTLKERLDRQTRRADDAEQACSDLRVQVSVLEENLMNERKKNKELAAQAIPVVPVEDAPADASSWFSAWSQDKHYERDSAVLLFLGSSGLARKKEIVDRLLRESSLKNRSIYLAIDACVEKGLMERTGGLPSGGHPTDLIRLTALGEWVFNKLTGNKPMPSEYDGLLKAHKTDKHIGLILQIADQFERLGCNVQREPTTIKLAGNHVFEPDLIVQNEGETFYLEVETGERMDRPSLEKKWTNAMIAGGGRICLAAPRVGEMTTLQSNIDYWAMETGKTPRLYLTNLDALRKRRPGDSPWVRVK